MATDVVPVLNDNIQKSFRNNVMRDRRIADVSKRIRDGTATLEDGHLYAERLGENLSKALKANLTAETLPDGRLYYNIAKRTVTPALEENYELTNEIAADIQKIVDARQQIGLGAVKADFPKERIQGLIDKMTAEGISLEDALKWLGEPIINNSEAFFDDYVDSNARFRQSVGLKAKLIRKVEAGACDWCKAMAGEFDYDDAPDNIYRRHEFCRCSVTYVAYKQKQDVWSKRTWQVSEEELATRKESGKLTQITPQERIEIANRVYRDTVISQMDEALDKRKAIRKYKRLSSNERLSLYDEAIQRRAEGKG